MSQAPPPYPGEQKGYPPPPNPAYPPPIQGYSSTHSPVTGYSTGSASPAPPQPNYSQAPPPPYSTVNPAQQHIGTTVVIQQPGFSVLQVFREAPVRTTCPHCRAEVITATHYETGTLSWIICLILCFVGCNAGCCLIPFCVDGCKDVIHSCPNCRQSISRWSRM